MKQAGRDPAFLPETDHRPAFESVLVRLVATAGVVGIGTAVAAVLGASNTAYWLTGLIVSVVSVLLTAVLWRSRTL